MYVIYVSAAVHYREQNVSLSSLEEVVEQEEEQAVDPELRSQPVRCNCTNHSAEPKYFSAWIFWIIFNESTARCSRSTSRFLCMLVGRYVCGSHLLMRNSRATSKLNCYGFWIPNQLNFLCVSSMWSTMWSTTWSTMWLTTKLTIWSTTWSTMWLTMWLTLWLTMWSSTLIDWHSSYWGHVGVA